MHFVTTRSFKYAGTTYNDGDGIYDSAYISLTQDANYTFYRNFVVPVPDTETDIEQLANTNSGGPPDMPYAVGYYSIPVSASTSGVFSENPVRIMSIRNTDSVPQGAVVNLWDCAHVADITTAHKIGGYQLGATQSEPVQILTEVGLVWSISQGDGSANTSNNQDGIALNSTGGVDVDYAAV